MSLLAGEARDIHKRERLALQVAFMFACAMRVVKRDGVMGSRKLLRFCSYLKLFA